MLTSVCHPSHYVRTVQFHHNVYFTVILQSVHVSSKWSPFFRFPHQNSVRLSPTPRPITLFLYLVLNNRYSYVRPEGGVRFLSDFCNCGSYLYPVMFIYIDFHIVEGWRHLMFMLALPFFVCILLWTPHWSFSLD
jgi:hypothetical protein